MKNRSRRTTRRETRRIDNKHQRAATRQALIGGHVRKTYRLEGGHPVQAPLIDEVGSARSKKQAKKRSGCPGRDGKRHHYIEDTRQIPTDKAVWDKKMAGYYYEETGTEEEHYKLCVYCGLEKVRSRGRRRWRTKQSTAWRWMAN